MSNLDSGPPPIGSRVTRISTGGTGVPAPPVAREQVETGEHAPACDTLHGELSGMVSHPPRKRTGPLPRGSGSSTLPLTAIKTRPEEGQGLLSPKGGFESLTGHHTPP